MFRDYYMTLAQKIIVWGGAVFICCFGCPAQVKAGEPLLAAVQMGDFRVKLLEAAQNRQGLQVFYRDKAIGEEQDNFYREVSMEISSDDLSEQGLMLTEISLYTGGANCCQGYYLLVGGQDNASCAGYIEPYDGGLIRNEDPKGYVVLDPAFQGYSREGTDLFLSRAESDRLSRLLLFENSQWHVDSAGQFPDFYQARLDETSADVKLNPVFRAIALAYYSLMKGNSTDNAKQVLKNNLPTVFQAEELVNEIFKDIQRAAGEFDPIENLSLN